MVRVENLCRELERELNASLENQMKAVMEREKCCRDGNAISDELFDTQRQLRASQAEVERLTEALKACWHAANTYDGNYTAACDNVMTIASARLNQLKNP
jgi:uncharacterized protein (DUF2252 family)